MSASPLAAKSLPLPFALPCQQDAHTRPFAQDTRPQRLWLALYLPQLALEAVQRDQHENSPAIVSKESHGRFVVAAANSAAQDHGIALGMPVNAAWALCPSLQVAMCEPALETRCLQQLAQRLYRYSSVISVQPPNYLLVEIQASLRLFGSLEELLAQIESTLHAAGHRYRHGIAPSVAAARLLAYAGDDTPVLQAPALASRLGRLPLTVIAADLPNLLPRLQKLGLRHLVDLFRLPRAGLRRRFGADLTEWLEKVLGQRPEMPQKWTPPKHYRGTQDLDDPLSSTDELLPLIECLIRDFCSWMRARSLHSSGLVLHFYHHKRPATSISLGLLHPANNATAMCNLLDLRMQREQLAAPVIGLRLDSLRLSVAQANNAAWWSGAQQADKRWWQTIEALQAKLGQGAVQSLICADDMRPELAWQSAAVKESGVAPTDKQRPAWLLAEPCRMHPQELHQLQIISRPERIHTGWWDDQIVRRDYFCARKNNQTLWVFRSVEGWFTHGIFELA